MGEQYVQHKLANGLEVVIERMPDVPSAAAGFLVKVGARDETSELAGVSHFLEHMMFKGTQRRDWRNITIDFDRMGSTYNAYTSEHRTVYFGWVRSADIENQIELLSDMMRSKLPPSEFDMEKNVILEEIAMAQDQLEHVAIDFLQEKVFAGHPLAWPILGYDKTVRAMQRDQMYDYFQRKYAPDNMLLIVAGNVDPDRVIKYAEQQCGAWEPSGDAPKRAAPKMHTGVDRMKVDRFQQQILALTFAAAPAAGELTESGSAMAAILGGDNSRFYWNIEQKGISGRTGAFHLDYEDVGMLILWGACEPERIEELHDAVRAEAARISQQPVEPHEVARVKNKRRTSLAVEAEAPYHRLTQLMDDMEYYGRPRTVEERLAEVEAVSVESIQRYLQAFPIDGGGHLASVGPRDWPAT